MKHITALVLSLTLCLVLVAGILWAGMGQPILARIQSSDAAIVRSSVGRGEKSTNSRAIASWKDSS